MSADPGKVITTWMATLNTQEALRRRGNFLKLDLNQIYTEVVTNLSRVLDSFAALRHSMRSLKLGTHALPPMEVEFLRLLLRLYGRSGKAHWSHSEVPPYDALLVDASSLNASDLRESQLQSCSMRRLTRAHDPIDTPDALPRPLCAQRLRHWLSEVESTLAAVPSGLSLDVTTTPSKIETPSNSSESQHQHTREQHPLPPKNAPRFRLLRWPRQGILRGDPTRIRMATLLTRRALNERDLVNLTGFDAHRCSVFMQILHASCLLTPASPELVQKSEDNRLTNTHAPSQNKEHAVRQPTQTKPSLPQGMISGLRKRLGL